MMLGQVSKYWLNSACLEPPLPFIVSGVPLILGIDLPSSKLLFFEIPHLHQRGAALTINLVCHSDHWGFVGDYHFLDLSRPQDRFPREAMTSKVSGVSLCLKHSCWTLGLYLQKSVHMDSLNSVACFGTYVSILSSSPVAVSDSLEAIWLSLSFSAIMKQF